jgi:antitoxin VapB
MAPTAKLCEHGGSQAVRLPKNFSPAGQGGARAPSRARRALEQMECSIEDVKAIFAEIDRLGGDDFLLEGRPELPPDAACHRRFVRPKICLIQRLSIRKLTPISPASSSVK